MSLSVRFVRFVRFILPQFSLSTRAPGGQFVRANRWVTERIASLRRVQNQKDEMRLRLPHCNADSLAVVSLPDQDRQFGTETSLPVTPAS
jgi:hypothetical protein